MGWFLYQFDWLQFLIAVQPSSQQATQQQNNKKKTRKCKKEKQTCSRSECLSWNGASTVWKLKISIGPQMNFSISILCSAMTNNVNIKISAYKIYDGIEINVNLPYRCWVRIFSYSVCVICTNNRNSVAVTQPLVERNRMSCTTQCSKELMFRSKLKY